MLSVLVEICQSLGSGWSYALQLRGAAQTTHLVSASVALCAFTEEVCLHWEISLRFMKFVDVRA